MHAHTHPCKNVHTRTCKHAHPHTLTRMHMHAYTHAHTHSLDVGFYRRRNITADNRAAGLSHVWNFDFMYTSLTVTIHSLLGTVKVALNLLCGNTGSPQGYCNSLRKLNGCRV